MNGCNLLATVITGDGRDIDYSKDASIHDEAPIVLRIPLLGTDGQPTVYHTRWRGIDCSDSQLAVLFRDAFNKENQ